MDISHAIRHTTTGEALHTWSGPGEPRALVQLQHGFGEYAERYVTEYGALVPHLVARGYTVVGLDLRGHGQATGRRGLVDVRQAVDAHVAARKGAHTGRCPVILVGHSLGGLVTLGSLVADPSTVSAAVVLSTVLVRPVPWPLRQVALGVGRALPTVPLGKPGPRWELSRRADVIARADADPLLYRGAPSLLTAASAVAVSAEVWAKAPRWQTPTLLLHGTDDTATDPRRTTSLAAVLPEDVATCLPIAGGRHELLHDTDGDSTLERVLIWIDTHGTP